jgi:hypothetical protein
MPLGAAGVVAIIAGLLVMRRSLVGRVMASVGLSVMAMYSIVSMARGLLANCGTLQRFCADQWQSVGWAALGLALAAYMLAAIWKARPRAKGAAGELSR